MELYHILLPAKHPCVWCCPHQAAAQIAAVLVVMLILDVSLVLVGIPLPPVAVVAWAAKWLGGLLAMTTSNRRAIPTA